MPPTFQILISQGFTAGTAEACGRSILRPFRAVGLCGAGGPQVEAQGFIPARLRRLWAAVEKRGLCRAQHIPRSLTAGNSASFPAPSASVGLGRPNGDLAAESALVQCKALARPAGESVCDCNAFEERMQRLDGSA